MEEKGQSIKDIKKMSFILKKAEKLSQAVYRVTDVLNDRDSIKWDMRAAALDVLSGVLSFIGKGGSSPSEKETIFRSIIKVCSYLQVTHGGTLVAHTHFLILKKEYEDFQNVIMSIIGDLEEKTPFFITQEDLENSEKLISVLENKSIKDISYKGQEMSFMSLPSRPFERAITNKALNRAVPEKRHSITPVNTERQEAIVRLVKDKKEVTIKDILEVPAILKTSSEKTIQRELLRLVHLGVLKKHGERRWSRYTLPR